MTAQRFLFVGHRKETFRKIMNIPLGPDRPEPTNNEKDKQARISQMAVITGATDFETKQLTAIVCHAANLMKTNYFRCYFSLTWENPNGGLFSDIGVSFRVGGRSGEIYIASKYASDVNKIISRNDLISTEKRSSCSLQKFFGSFIEQGWDKLPEPPFCIFCTNMSLAEEVEKSLIKRYKFNEHRNIFDEFGTCDELLRSISDYAYSFDVNEEESSSLFAHFKNTSDFSCLAKLLAEYIYKQKTIDFRNGLFKKYRYFIENCISKKKYGCYEVNEEFLNASLDFKYAFENEYGILISSSSCRNDRPRSSLPHEGLTGEGPVSVEIRTHAVEDMVRFSNPRYIWDDIRRKGIRVFGTVRDKVDRSNEVVLPKQIKDQQIEKFLKSFIICCRVTLDKEKVSKLIMVENLLPPVIQNTASSKTIYERFSDWMRDWQKQPSRFPISLNDVADKLESIKISLLFDYFATISKENIFEIKNIKLQCKTEKMEELNLYIKLRDWLRGSNEAGNFAEKIETCNYHPLIVVQILELIKVESLFLQGKQFEQHSDGIVKSFSGKESSLILIIYCYQMPDIADTVKMMLDDRRLSQNLTHLKKVLIIDRYSSSLDSENLLFGDFTIESREDILRQNESISLCGTTIIQQELFQDHDSFQFFLDVQDFSNGTGVKLNLNQDNFVKIEQDYIMRSLNKFEEAYEVPSKQFWERRRLFLNKTYSRHAVSSHIEFNEFLNSDFSVIVHENNNLSNRENIPGLDRMRKKDPHRFQLQRTNTSKKFHVILNVSGSGKSCYMKWLANFLQTKFPSSWILKFKLYEHSTPFDKLESIQTMDELIALRLIFEFIYLNFQSMGGVVSKADRKPKTAQDISGVLLFSGEKVKLDENKTHLLTSEQLVLLKIFANKFNKQELVILLDGFDQLPPHCKPIVLQWQSILLKFDAVQNMYLVSRSHDRQKVLKDCSFYQLEKVNIKEQFTYTQRFLSNAFDTSSDLMYNNCSTDEQHKICEVISNLLTLFLDNLMEFPLFMSEGLKIILPLIRKYFNFEASTFTLQMLSDCEESFELLRMIEIFIGKKLSIANQQVTNEILTRDSVNKIHSILAVYNFSVKNNATVLLSHEEHKDLNNFIEKVKNGSDMFGMIAGVKNDFPIFLHEIFAEYFTAVWFSQHDDDLVKGFLKSHVYESNDNMEIRYFLDKMICKRNSHCRLYMAILDNSKEKVEEILGQHPDSINRRDNWGRTPLQLALLYGSKKNDEIVCLLLDHNYQIDFNSNDTFFEWSTLDYAHYRDKANGEGMYFKQFIMFKSLNKELKTNQMKGMINFIKKTPCKCARTDNHVSSICCIGSFEKEEDSNYKNN